MRNNLKKMLSALSNAVEYGSDLIAGVLKDQEVQHQYTMALLQRGRTDTSENHIYAYLSDDSIDANRKKEVLTAIIRHQAFRDRIFFWGKAYLEDKKVPASDRVEIAIFAITKGVIYQGVGLFNDETISLEDKTNIFTALWNSILKKPYFPAEQAEVLINRYLSIPNISEKNKKAVVQRYLSSRFCNFKSGIFIKQFRKLDIKQRCWLLRWLRENHDSEKKRLDSYALVDSLSDLVNSRHYSYDEQVEIWGTMVAIDQRLSPKATKSSKSEINRGLVNKSSLIFGEAVPFTHEMDRLQSDDHITWYDARIFYEYGYRPNMNLMSILGGINAIRLKYLESYHQFDNHTDGIVIKSSLDTGNAITYREVHVKRLLAYTILCLWNPGNTSESPKDLLDQYLTRMPRMIEDNEKTNELKKMLEHCPYLIVLIPDTHPLRSDLPFIKKMLKDNGEILAFLSRSQRNDRTLVEVATKNTDKAWSYVGENRMDVLLFRSPKFLKSPGYEKAYYSLTVDEQLQFSYVVQMLKSSCNHQDLLNHLGVLIAQKYSLIKSKLFPGLADQEIENRIKDIQYEALGKVLFGYFVGLVPDLSAPDPEWRISIEAYNEISIESFRNALIWRHDQMKVEDGMRFFPTSLKDQASVIQSETPIPIEKITGFLTQKEKLKFEEAYQLTKDNEIKSENKPKKDPFNKKSGPKIGG